MESYGLTEIERGPQMSDPELHDPITPAKRTSDGNMHEKVIVLHPFKSRPSGSAADLLDALDRVSCAPLIGDGDP